MSGTASVSVIILARTAGPATTRAIGMAQDHASEVQIIVSGRTAARELRARHPDVIVRCRAFRTPAEALTNLDARYEHRLWHWAEELLDTRAWDHVARIAQSGSTAAHEFCLATNCNGRSVPHNPPFESTLRMWHGHHAPLATDGHGNAAPAANAPPLRATGAIVHQGFGSATQLIDRIDYEIGCMIHAAVDRGLSDPPAAIGVARLFGGWLSGWLRSGLQHPTEDLVVTFVNRFWIPLFFNARLREAAAELAQQGRAEWLTAHVEFDGSTT